jgi:23S rRNA pseudouridine1911/1915/1917 synthase
MAPKNLLQVLFSDHHLLVVVKPAMIATQSEPSGEPSLEDYVKEWVRQETGKQGAIFLHPIHRLDKAVSGIVLFARSSKALSRLNEAMRKRQIGKTYYALVEGNPPSEAGQLIHYLRHGDFRADIVASEKEGGKIAELSYRVLKTHTDRALLEIILVTGRYHQIRAQLAAIGCPVIGDRKYGSSRSFAYPGIALHHGKMDVSHPVSKELLHLINLPEFLCESKIHTTKRANNVKHNPSRFRDVEADTVLM